MLSISKTVRDEVLCNSARDQFQRYFLLGVYQHPRLSEGKKVSPTNYTVQPDHIALLILLLPTSGPAKEPPLHEVFKGEQAW